MLYLGDALEILKTLESNSIDCCVTSPPYYGLRDYGVSGQIGLENSVNEYVEKLVLVFREVRRVIKNNGTLWLNLGDSYNGGGRGGHVPNNTGNKNGHAKSINVSKGLKSKDLMGIPWRIAFGLQEDGWYLRQDIIWNKPNAMPESVKDRCTKSHEYIFLLAKSEKYYFDSNAIKEPTTSKNSSKRKDVKYGSASESDPRMRTKENLHSIGQRQFRQKRSVWSVTTKPLKDAHFAAFPKDLIAPCILAGCPNGGTVLDPFFGAGTVGVVATEQKKNFIGIELNPEYLKIAKNRIGKDIKRELNAKE